MDGDFYLKDLVQQLQGLKRQCEGAFGQVAPPERLFQQLAHESNSIAIIVKHIAGNLRSRFSDFLTSDGEKPDRDRDNEFTITASDTWPALLERWEAGWSVLLSCVRGLSSADLEKTITIRAEKMSVLTALQRSFGHLAYHAGQIMYLSKLAMPEGWKWLSVPPGGSAKFNAEMIRKHSQSTS